MNIVHTLRALLLLLAFLALPKQDAFSQKKAEKPGFIQKLFSSEKDSTRSGSIMILPALAVAPETGLEFGLVGNYTFFVDKKDSIIRSSHAGIIATMTAKKQSNIKLFANLWSRNNTYHYIAELGYRDYPFNFYGIGDQTLAKNKVLLTQKFFRLNLEGEKRLLENYYAGINLKFENFSYKKTSAAIGGSIDPDTFFGTNGGKYMAIGVSQVYDSRNSNTATSSGLYARLKYAYAPNVWGGDNFSGSFLSLDLRSFFPLNSKLVLGFNSIYQSTIGKDVPFYLMPQLGNDEMMRGYYSGRFRDKNLLTLQSELRYRVHPRFALATFISGGTAYHSALDLSRVKLSYGTGIRYFFNLQHETSIRLDYALGEGMPGEKRQSGFYLSLGQAF